MKNITVQPGLLTKYISGLPVTITLLFILFTQFTYGQHGRAQSSAWSTNPFDDREFVENKGQFGSDLIESDESILYTVHHEGIRIYFTAQGVSWRYDHATRKREEEVEASAHSKKRPIEEEGIDVKTYFLRMKWENSNPDVKVIGEDPYSYYRTYGDVKHPDNTLVAQVYKKIIYKDIYPHIDVEYMFPEDDKTGIKYNVVLHPGADASMFKMKYSKAKNISVDGEGNVLISSAFGLFTDHAPLTFQDGKQISSSFAVKGNTVSFDMQSGTQNSDIIIDPWFKNPVFSRVNKAYDVDYDKNGNVWAFGGIVGWAPQVNFELVKIDNTGAIKWKYSTNLFNGNDAAPGDFFVDYNTSSSYIFEGDNLPGPFNPGNNNSAEAIKLNANGILMKFYIPVDPAHSMSEFSRVTYNCATKTALATGGGVAGCYQVATLDTNFNTVTYHNVLANQGVTDPWNNSYHDCALLISDNAGDAYILTNKSYAIDPAHADNFLFRAPMTAPVNHVWGVYSKHHFTEGGSGIHMKYGMSNSIYLQNGYNGIAVNCNFLVTSDGHVMKKWDKANGSLMKQATISPDSLDFGGLDVSHCNHIYQGYYNTIKIFDDNLNPMSSLSAQDTVYDLKLDEYRHVVYAVGRGFVQSIDITENCFENVYATATNGTCVLATATAEDTGLTACISESKYTFQWSNGATTQTISNLATGTYTVFVTHDYMISCHPFSWKDTAVVDVVNKGGIAATTNHTDTKCTSASGTATANVTAGSAPYTYAWTPAGGSSASAVGLAAGDYTVQITDASGCTRTETVTIASTGTVTATVSHTDTKCTSSIGTASVNVTAGTSPYTYNWLPSGGSTGSVNGLGVGSYTVLTTDASGCSRTDTLTIATSGTITTTMAHTDATCANPNGIASVNVTSGTSPYTYNWSSGGTTGSVTDLTAGSYTVLTTDTYGCSRVDTVTLASTGSITALANSVTVCAGQNAVLTASGGVNYSWSNGATTASIAPATTASASYTVFVTSGVCKDTAYATLSVNPAPAPVALGSDLTLCAGQTYTLDAGAHPGAGFFWSTGDTSQTLEISGVGTYWVIVAINKCFVKDTVSTFLAPKVHLFDSSLCTVSPIVLDPGPGASGYLWSDGSNAQTMSVDQAGTYWVAAMFGNCLSSDSAVITGDGTGGALYIPNAFTPNDDHLNELFTAKGTGIREFSMTVFDRWGNMLFKSDDINKGWDGRIEEDHYPFKKDGKEPAQEDVYIWKVNYTTQCFPKKINKEIGTISIVK